MIRAKAAFSALVFWMGVMTSASVMAQNSEELIPGIGGNADTRMEPEGREFQEFESAIGEPASPAESSLPPERPSTPPPAPVSIESLSDLSKLAPFSDVSVLQKRYLPKTERFQLSGGMTMITNDPWYWGLGANARLGYYLREAWGLEFSGEFFSHSERDQVKDLRTNNSLNTDSIVYMKNYIGADLVWTPMYGKMSLKNLRIIPFDLYFAVGGGVITPGNAKESSASAVHIGTGQIFALSKSTAFRWSFDMKNFNATPSSSDPSKVIPLNNFNYFTLSLGVSYFFPEAKYR